MMIAAWTWLTSRVGAGAACVTAGLGILWMLLSGARRDGRRDAQADIDQASLRHARDAAKIYSRLRAATDDEINAHLRRPEDRQ